jgi:hypothetical protein
MAELTKVAVGADIAFLEGSQALPACPNNSSVDVKT